jgi:membrane-associated HD superfamily phosphohydrolase
MKQLLSNLLAGISKRAKFLLVLVTGERKKWSYSLPNVPVYVIAVLLVIIVLLGVTCSYQLDRYGLLKAEYSSYKAQVEAQVARSRAREAELKAAYLHIHQTLEDTRETLTKQVDDSYATYDQLRRATNTNSERVRSLTDALKGVNCGSETKTQLNRGLERLENRVLKELARSRDQAIIDLQACVSQWNELAAKSASR